MYMEKDNNLLKDTRTSFLGIIKGEDDLDDSTFSTWRSELEKELPSFWEEISGSRR